MQAPQPKATMLQRNAVDESDSDSEDEESMQFKIILVGDGAVGKTSLATRFCEDQFVGKT